MNPSRHIKPASSSTGKRTAPDVSYEGDPATGVAIRDSFSYGSSTPWIEQAGTSAGAPQWAALIAIVDQGLAAGGKGSLDGPGQTLPQFYGLPAADFHDITTGYNGYSAGTGYDLVTGRGSPIANLLVPDLVNSDTLALKGATVNAVAGQSFQGTLATFTVSDPAALSSQFTATINWGDGQTSNGTIAFNSATQSFNLNGSHTYAAGGAVSITVTVRDALGRATVVVDSVTVQFPKPSLGSISPGQAAAGSANPLTLTVAGSAFFPQSVVDWNGTAQATTYVSPTQLTAAIPAADFAMGGNDQVTVFNPGPGGGTLTAATFQVVNPAPALTSIAPSQAVAGSSNPVTVTLTGSGFCRESVADWNGTALATTYVSPTQLTATIPAADFAMGGNDQVTVFNPGPGGGTFDRRDLPGDHPGAGPGSDRAQPGRGRISGAPQPHRHRLGVLPAVGG